MSEPIQRGPCDEETLELLEGDSERGCQAAAEIRRLRAALEKFGVHYESCPHLMHNVVPADVPEGTPCNCGLDAALASGGKADSCQPSAISDQPEGETINPPDVVTAVHVILSRVAGDSEGPYGTDELVADLNAILAAPDSSAVASAKAEPAGVDWNKDEAAAT